MKITGLLSLSIIPVSLLLVACSQHEQRNAVPKPEGWPRIELPAQNYQQQTFGRSGLCLNSEASVESEPRDNNGWWITVRYPQFRNAAVYLTLSPVSKTDVSEVMDNRRERMELNAGGATTELTELLSAGGWHCLLAKTHTSLTTPVQLLATDSATVLSGSLYLSLPDGSSADSIAPIVKAVSDDMIFLLKNLR